MMNSCKQCGKYISKGLYCSECLSELGHILPPEVVLSDEEFSEMWHAHTRCSKGLKPACEECLDVEMCKTRYEYNMLNYQKYRKQHGEITPRFETWMKATYLKMRKKEGDFLPAYEEWLKEIVDFDYDSFIKIWKKDGSK